MSVKDASISIFSKHYRALLVSLAGIFAAFIFESRASAQSIPTLLLDALAHCDPPQSDKEAAAAFIEQLKTSGMTLDKRFFYYQAIALRATGQKQEALKIAKAAAESGYVPILPESRELTRNIARDLAPASTLPYDVQRHTDAIRKNFDDQLADYPYGTAEALKLSFFHPQGEIAYFRDEVFKPKYNHAIILRAAQSYAKMHMYDSALRMYNRLEGWDFTYGSPVSLKTWNALAAFHKEIGNWEAAQGYIFKSIISRGMTDERRQFIAEMDANIRVRRTISLDPPSPDAGKLQEIMIGCAKTDLFFDAFHAINEMQTLREEPDISAQIALHQAIIDMIQEMNRCHFDRVTFRGVEVNASTLAGEKKLIEDLQTTPPRRP